MFARQPKHLHRWVAVLAMIGLAASTTACGNNKSPKASSGQVQAAQTRHAGMTIYINGWDASNSPDDQALIEQKLDGSTWVIPSDYQWSFTPTGNTTVPAIYNGTPDNELTIQSLPANLKVGYDHDFCVADDELVISLSPAFSAQLTNPAMWENNVQSADTDDCYLDANGVVVVPPGYHNSRHKSALKYNTSYKPVRPYTGPTAVKPRTVPPTTVPSAVVPRTVAPTPSAVLPRTVAPSTKPTVAQPPVKPRTVAPTKAPAPTKTSTKRPGK